MGRQRIAAGIAVAAVVAAGAIALLDGGDDPSVSQQALTQDEAAGISATLDTVDSGVPLPYEQDGDTFQNREGLLPDQPQGYYREYTVETPGSDDRGARRLVIGRAGETYYTRDHYESFERIDPEDYR